MADTSYLSWPFFTDVHKLLAERVRGWAAKHLMSLPEGDEFQLSRRLVEQLGEEGILKYSVVAPYGGVFDKIDVRSMCLIRESLGYASAMGDFACAMQGLGSGPISLFGTKEICERYLPKVSQGRAIAAFALSEEEAGSDPAALAATAKEVGEYFVLNGEKAWISNAGIADFYVVFARTGEAPGTKGISAIVVDAATEGLSTEPVPLIAPHPIGTVRFKNCKVPLKNLLGKRGEGFKVAMATLDVFRSTVGAAAVGFARRALDETVKHVKQRKLFGETLGDFQMTKEKIADMAVEIDAAALLVYRAAWAKDSGQERVTREASMAKLYATEVAQRIIDSAVQLFGGLGVKHGSIVERLYRDIRPLRIYEGASEIQKLIIAGKVLEAP